MSLLKSEIGKTYVVKSIHVEPNVQRRLQALGLTGGTPIEVLNNKKSGSVIFKVRGTRLAVGKNIAVGITLQEG